ncbi:DEAD/DEAH box helicase [Neobacillus sp. LXY-1]|uniref:DEAD/DEAH box helicase n=1 Tax=Neobacillus sp. LXY-1 TaxID=3379133 RepID=UPI003EE039DF
MNSTEKTILTNINKIEEFGEIIKKLTINEELTSEEKSYILGCAILFMKHYELDRRYTSYLDIAYYIILKYSITYEDYLPLYDFSINFGFYPIAKDIISYNLLKEELSLNDSLMELKIESYKNQNYIETYQQKKVRNSLLNDNSQEVSYIAPTSFGKSSLVLDHIIQNESKNKIGIIVPTKSLLVQTYRNVRQATINRRIIIHDEMYQGDETFIAIFTQERALRLLDKHDVSFDLLYIDEAHNLFGKDPRSILLSRLIRRNRKLNPNQKVVYLSPLISESHNLKLDKQQEISEQKISNNLKEPEIFEYRSSIETLQYNRFVNEFYKLDFNGDMYSYITQHKGQKNFIYIRSPRKIEMFVKNFINRLNVVYDSDSSIQKLKEDLSNFVHEDFYMINLLTKGVVYLHGKLPDIVKEYLEFKFKDISNLRYVVANSVILEGINLPIDTLFILNTHSMNGKTLTNLIGRVNRLNNIFNGYSNQLHKLLPQVHFVNNDIYNRANGKMENKIKTLRSNIFEDRIENPTLESFNLDDLKIDKNNKQAAEEKFRLIKENEDLLMTTGDDKNGELKRYLINSGLESVYDITISQFLTKLNNQIETAAKGNIENWSELGIIDKIYTVFIKDVKDYIQDFEFLRLTNEHARNYYKMYLQVNRTNSLKENITLTFHYFKKRVKEGNSLFYMGASYGEVKRETGNYAENNKEVYVDLSSKSDSEIINLAIVKLKIEDDFVNYHLNKLIVALYDFSLITQDEYHLAVYGTNDEKKINLIKTGLSLSLITKLQKDNQLNNISLDSNNNLMTNSAFEIYKKSMQGFYRFELDKFL